MMDDAPLVTRSLQGERRAYETLVRKYQNVVFGLAFSYVHHEQDAEDLVQEAFIRGYLRLETLDDPARFGSWLKTIVVNGAKQLFRKRSAVTAQALNLDTVGAELDRQALEDFQQRRERQKIWDEVSTLPEIYRTPLVLHYASRLSYEEIARFLGLKVSTVRGRLQKARVKMRSALTEDMAMKTVDVVEKVSEEIYKIARREIREEIDPGDIRHLVLFLDVPTELNVAGHEGKQVLIRGHKMALGESEGQAEEILGNIQLRHDAVEDWVAAGQHPGERFCGTDQTSAGELVPNIRKSGGRVRAFDEKTAKSLGNPIAYMLFPHRAPIQEQLDRMRNAVPQRAHRISLIFDKVVDMAVPRQQISDRLREGFTSNWWDEERVHGHAGKSRMEVAIPPDMAITLVGWTTGATRFEGLRGNVLLVNGRVAEIEDVEGDLSLLHTHVGAVRNIEGNVLQFCHQRDESGHWNEGKRKRPKPAKTILANVTGEIELDLGHVALEVRNPGGHVSTKNRTGNTTVSADKWIKGKKWRLESRSGDVTVRLTNELYQEQSVTCSTLSGELDYSLLSQDEFHKANCPDYMLFSTRCEKEDMVNKLNADVLITVESGNIKLDVLKT